MRNDTANTPAQPAAKAAANPYWLECTDNANRTHFRRRASRRERERFELLRDWYGEFEAAAVIDAHRRPPAPIAAAVQEVVRGLGLARNLLFESVLAEWPRLVGPDLAAKSIPSELQGNNLLVEVAGSNWLFMMQTVHRPEIIRRLNTFSDGKIRTVRFVPQGRIDRRREAGA